MTLSLQYELDYHRIILAVICDSSGIIPQTIGQPGTVVYAYFQTQLALVTPNVLFYRIITRDGNIGGYCLIQVENGVAVVLSVQLRPAFVSFSAQISQIISIFIQGNLFLQDLLY